jgi:uncharacterized repeat protein (TIGR03806 family)
VIAFPIDHHKPLERGHRRTINPKRLFRVFSAVALITTAAFVATGCGANASHHAANGSKRPAREVSRPFPKLSDYALFIGDPVHQQPADGVIPYDLNTPLFSDYAQKLRFVKLPKGTHADYRPDTVLDFPVGTVIAKTFAYPNDARDPAKGRRLIETRILKRDADGWVGLPYIWNPSQTDAELDVAGDTRDITWTHTDGQVRKINYMIPNANQCKGCHKSNETITPIGPRARQLNGDFAYASGTENQLAYWSRNGLLANAPSPAEAPRLARWNDSASGTLDSRARAWLEINCAHCHNPGGAARNSGLDLLSTQQNPTAFGVHKTPVAAGLGSGGLDFDIVPGKPDKSILAYRIASTHPGIMMPELGKRLVHDEGVALIREWIAAMPNDRGRQARLEGGPANRVR